MLVQSLATRTANSISRDSRHVDGFAVSMAGWWLPVVALPLAVCERQNRAMSAWQCYCDAT